MDIEVEGVSLNLPKGIGNDYSIFMDIISPDTWNNHLTDENRESLMKFLPDFPENDLEEKTRTLERFFMHENFKFGTPIKSFFNKLVIGEFDAAIGKMKKMHKKLQYKSYKLRQKEYVHDLLEDVLVSRQYHLEEFSSNNNLVDKMPERIGSKKDTTSVRVRKRYLKELKQIRSEAGFESDLSDEDISSEGVTVSLNKKQRRQLFMIESSYPSDLVPVRGTFSQGSLPLDLELRLTHQRNPFDGSDEQYRNMLATHFALKKAKKSASLDTRGITMQSVLQRTDIQPVRRPLPRLETNGVLPSGNKPFFIQRDSNKRSVKSVTHIKIEANGSVPEEVSSYGCSSDSDNPEAKNTDVHNGTPSSQTKHIKIPQNSKIKKRKGKCRNPMDEYPIKIKEEADIKLEEESQQADTCNVSLSAELTQETHISFFSLLRDVVCSTPLQRMSKAQLEGTVKTWQDSAISPLNEWFSICPSWHFVLPCAVNFLRGNVPNDFYPSDFVPYIEYKASGKFYQWIGAGRDSDANLEGICQYWLLNRDHISNDWVTISCSSSTESVETKVLPSPRSITTFTVKPPSDADKKAYHFQETQRYEKPHKAFTFRIHGYESVIGPVKGIYSEKSGTTSKARGHSLVVDDRPPFVTILSLVRDAVARLPNGEGTKVDICELLRESQFIVPTQGSNHDSTLNSVASGALDRLQYGEDPCVKYDTSRKLWVYLHRDRSEEEFERMHHLNAPMGTRAKHHTSSRKTSKIKKEDAHAATNVCLEPLSSSIRMDGNEVKMKTEDRLENWVKIAMDASNTSKQSDKYETTNLKSDVKEKGQEVVICSSNIGNTLKPNKIYKKCDSVKALESKELIKAAASALQRGMSPTVKTQQNVTTLPLIAIQGDNTAVSAKRKLLRPMGPTVTKSYSAMESPTSTGRDGVAKVTGIKVLQYPNISSGQGKSIISGSPIVMQTGGSSLQALVGQKMILPGNRVLIQGGKVLHTVPASGILSGNKVLTGVFPQSMMTVGGLKSGDQAIEGNLSPGRYIQIASMDSPGSFQKVTLVPQMNQVRSAGSPKGHLTLQASGNKKSTSEVRLKVAAGSNNLTSAAGSLISLGGKQIILTTKAGANFGSSHLQQIMLTDSASDVNGDSVKTVAVGQPLVLPASTLQGSPINLKRLQTYQSFKVIPASQLSQQKGKQEVTAMVTTPTSQSSNTTKTSLPIKPNITDVNEKK